MRNQIVPGINAQTNKETSFNFMMKLAASPLASRGFAPRGIITSSITYTAERIANFRTYPAGKHFHD